MKTARVLLVFAMGCLSIWYFAVTQTRLHAQQAAAALKINADDIGGVVASSKGPEAGVWVIAETSDLGTKLSRTVVTDDQGRFLVPDLPRRVIACGRAAMG